MQCEDMLMMIACWLVNEIFAGRLCQECKVCTGRNPTIFLCVVVLAAHGGLAQSGPRV